MLRPPVHDPRTSWTRKPLRLARRQTVADRRLAAAGCAAVVLAIRTELAHIERRVLQRALKTHNVQSLPATHTARLRALLIAQGLQIAEELAKLPPPPPRHDSTPDDATAAAEQARTRTDRAPFARTLALARTASFPSSLPAALRHAAAAALTCPPRLPRRPGRISRARSTLRRGARASQWLGWPSSAPTRASGRREAPAATPT